MAADAADGRTIPSIIDSDAHVIESPATWDFMDEADRKYMPSVTKQTFGNKLLDNEGNPRGEFWLIDGRVHDKDKNIGSDTPEVSREMLDVGARLAHMDALGIDVQVLYPTLFLRPVARGHGLELALCRAYNRWLGDIWKQGAGRLRWVVMPPLLSMDKAVEEIRWARDNGACGVFMRGFECEMSISDPYFHPVFETASALDMPICVHTGLNSFALHDALPSADSFVRFHIPTVYAFQSLALTGTPALFPDLRWGFIEAGAMWVPFVIHDIENRYKRQGKEVPDNVLTANRFTVACKVTDDLDYIIGYAGEDNLVVGTDYGHHDFASEIDAMSLIRDLGKLDEGVVDKILGPNARALYGLD